ncbi:13381_t:CDS:10 [Entrophospora sp. SA101]|nr:13381_t:CDS:10 [Entrophospora sp. SA101]
MDNKIAIILPTTLKLAGYADLEKLASFEEARSLNYGLFMAVDEDDNYDEEKLHSIFKNAKEISIKKYPIEKPPRICSMWRESAQEAYEKGYEFFLLLGDDIEISGNWYEEVVKLFQDISEKNKVSFGVGCVCLKDNTSPNFPTFPVVHRKHIELFGEIFPKEFVNQDADPYLYELRENSIVVDRNIEDISPEQIDYLRNLEKAAPARVRVNEQNMGASFSRNRGMQENDDVLVDEKIISAYTDSLLNNPEKDGFVGKSILPRDNRQATDAVHMAQTSFFWTICDHFPQTPWGVTANLLVKRHNDVNFDLDFPKTGGARGDGLLLNKHPQHTFRTLPNVWEWTAILSASSVVLDNCPYLTGSKRALVALESNIPRNASELGHALCSVSNGRFENVTKRFKSNKKRSNGYKNKSPQEQLDYFYANKSQVKEINLEYLNFNQPKRINIQSSNLQQLILNNLPKLKELYCSHNKLTTLDLSDYASLEGISCSDNQLNQIKLPKGEKLRELILNNNNLHQDLSFLSEPLKGMNKLERLHIYDTDIDSDSKVKVIYNLLANEQGKDAGYAKQWKGQKFTVEQTKEWIELGFNPNGLDKLQK